MTHDPRFPEVANAVSTLGQGESNLEEIAAVQPDLLLASRDSEWLSAAGELGIPVLRFEGETPESLKEAVRLVGAVLGPDAAYRAEQFAEFYDEVLGSIQAQMADIENPKTVYFSGTQPCASPAAACTRPRWSSWRAACPSAGRPAPGGRTSTWSRSTTGTRK